MNPGLLCARLEGYRLAWETRDPKPVIKLFTEDATYQETPFSQPMRGREAIRQYSLEFPLPAEAGGITSNKSNKC